MGKQKINDIEGYGLSDIDILCQMASITIWTRNELMELNASMASNLVLVK
ncbi:MAG: hypothetical protein PHF46_04385 [Candidatus Gracilibacteria bacterium]|nr:hypothetical protein [Candidatus Gracilibacteria bacterium]MDD3120621.1 hypothetical protein [Candidatus Gracilibacteria bacterium]